MANSEKTALLKIKASDTASSVISKVGDTTKKTTASMNVDFKKMTIAFAAVTAAVSATTYAITQMATRAGKITGLAQGFERNFGNATESLDRLRESAQGTISDFDLMSSSNKAALLGITTNIDDLAGLMVTARIRARELGIDATQAFDDIVTGIGRQSPLILDNLGIKIPDAIKVMMESMSEAEQSQILLNYAIDDGAKLAAEYGEVQLTSADKVAALQAKITNFKDEALVKLTPVLETVLGKMGDLVQKAGDAANELRNGTTPAAVGLRWALTDEKEGLIPAVKRVGESFNGMVNTITGENKTAMENFTTMLAGWAYILGGIADIIDSLIKKIDSLIGKQKELNKTNPWNNPISGISSLFNKDTGTKATGGIASGWTQVGESGPEVVKLPSGSHVYNNEDSKKMMGDGGITININAPTYGINDLKSSILEAVNEATARQNRLANYNLL